MQSQTHNGTAATVIKTEGVTKVYQQGNLIVEALRGVSLDLAKSDFLVMMGPSGSGKSTLLHLMGCLDRPSAGEIFFGGRELSSLSDRELSSIRRQKIGFIFQFFNLIPSLTAVENVALPLVLDGHKPNAVRHLAEQTLERVGLGKRTDHWPHQLSGGEMQRVAIARALVTSPEVILADEPTGNLDSRNGAQVLEIMQHLQQVGDITIAMVTHDESVARIGSRVVIMKDGLIGVDSGRR